MATTVLLWVGFHLVVFVILAIDLGLLRKGSHAVTPREATAWTLLWVSVSLLLCAGIYAVSGSDLALQFLNGYLVEYSLSVDNLFVFLILFQYFRVPPEFRHRLLFWGIVGQFAMRAPLLIVGTTLVNRFHWTQYFLGAFLLYAAWGIAFSGEEESFDPANNRILALIRRILPLSKDSPGGQFFIREDDKVRATPLFLTLVFLNITDLMFAFDSIPAVIGVVRSQNTFIAYSSNVCAILGLRSLFFVVASMMDKFRYWKVGVAVVLAFVGTKMMVTRWLQISNSASLAIIASVLAVCIVGSVVIKPPSK